MISRLDQNLGKLEQQQNDDFNRWTIRSGRASELLDKFEGEMPTVDKPLAVQLEDVEKQEQEFDVRIWNICLRIGFVCFVSLTAFFAVKLY